VEKARVLVLADQEAALASHKTRLSAFNYEVHEARHLEEALKRCKQQRFPVVVADLGSAGNGEGLRAARKIREVSAETQVVLLTPEDAIDKSPEDYRVNIFAYLDRPSDQSENRLPKTIASVFEELQKTEVQKQMLSFLTHTMVNTLSGAIPALEHTLELGQEIEASDFEKGEIFSAINNLGYLRTSLTTVDSMLKTYKLLVRQPENLRSAWNDDHGGDSGIDEVVESAIGAIVHRLMFQEPFFQKLDLFASQLDLDAGQKRDQFMAEVLLASPGDRPTVRDWVARNFPFIEVATDTSRQPLNRDGIRSNIIFSVLTELLLNAIKYTDLEDPIQVRWNMDDASQSINISNSYDPENRPKRGSEAGQDFINALLRPLDGLSFRFKYYDNTRDKKEEERSGKILDTSEPQKITGTFEATFVMSQSAFTTGG